MRVWRKDDGNSPWGHRWWIQDQQLNWWYSNEDVLGNIYGWVYCGDDKRPVVYNEGLYESSELAYLVTQGRSISDTLPHGFYGLTLPTIGPKD